MQNYNPFFKCKKNLSQKKAANIGGYFIPALPDATSAA